MPSDFSEIPRVTVTDRARSVIDQLREKHGPLLFHQSGGCCDGSAPMCFAEGDFIVGSRDLCLGEIHGCRFYMAPDQFEYYRNMRYKLDEGEIDRDPSLFACLTCGA